GIEVLQSRGEALDRRDLVLEDDLRNRVGLDELLDQCRRVESADQAIYSECHGQAPLNDPWGGWVFLWVVVLQRGRRPSTNRGGSHSATTGHAALGLISVTVQASDPPPSAADDA